GVDVEADGGAPAQPGQAAERSGGGQTQVEPRADALAGGVGDIDDGAAGRVDADQRQRIAGGAAPAGAEVAEPEGQAGVARAVGAEGAGEVEAAADEEAGGQRQLGRSRAAVYAQRGQVVVDDDVGGIDRGREPLGKAGHLVGGGGAALDEVVVEGDVAAQR